MRKLIFPLMAWLALMSTILACATVGGGGPTPTSVVPPTDTVGPTEAPPTDTTVAPTVEASPTSVPPTSVPPTPTPVPPPTAVPATATTAGTPVTLLSIRMFSETAGWGIGNLPGDPTDHILHTSDGGITWKKVTPPEPPGKAATAGFLDLQNAWVIFADRAPASPPTATHVWRTTNGGQNWIQSSPVDLSGGGTEYFTPLGLVFVSTQAGWLLGHVGAGMNHDYVMGFSTGDGGANWTKVIDPVGAGAGSLYMSCTKTGMAFISVSTGWVTGNCNGVQPGAPYFQKTTDGGHHWAAQNVPVPGAAPNLFSNSSSVACGTYDLAFTSPSNGTVAMKCQDFSVNPAQGQAWLYVTTDGGGTWTPHALPLPYGDSFFLNATMGWWLGSGVADASSGTAMYQTSDGGANWTLLTNKLSWTGQMDFVTAQIGWVVAHNGSDIALVRTANGGSKWTLIKPGVVP